MTSDEFISRIRVKNLLRKEKIPGLFSGRYRFSPYMACGHRCLYCDGRFEKYRLEGDFDRDITARINAPELLEEQLSKAREPGPVCISSGVSDAYQPAEKKLNLTGRCAEVLAKFDHPVVVHTKSSLPIRDMDIWHKVHERSAFTLMVSLTTLSESIRAVVEPGASPVKERLEMIRAFRDRGMNAGVLAMPFIPGLTDSEESMKELLEKVKEAGAQFVIPGLLTLKPGRQKDFFFSRLRSSNPKLTKELIKLYSDNNKWGNPPDGCSREFYRKVNELWSFHRINDLIPHSIYRNQFTLYDQFSILLRDMKILYRRKGTPTERLQKASDKFGKWVLNKRQYYARRRNLNYAVIDDYLRAMIHSGELADILHNSRLAAFLKRVEQGEVFNYFTLELEKTD